MMTKKRKHATVHSVNMKLNKLIGILDAWTQPKGDGLENEVYIQAQARQVHKLLKQLRSSDTDSQDR